MIINHCNYTKEELQKHFSKTINGVTTELEGEKKMYETIINSCNNDKDNTWHFWYSLKMNINSGDEIDFLLLCKYGIMVVEVKGGKVIINDGQYCFQVRLNTIPFPDPFTQASRYKQDLIKIGIGKNVFIGTMCAFPFSKIERTHGNDELDLSYKIWQESKGKDFCQQCIDVLKRDIEKDRQRYPNRRFMTLSDEDMLKIANSFSYTTSIPVPSYSEIAQWLNVSSLDVLESLHKNDRLIIEGGPGTGKTTIAKAFIKRNRNLKGLYLCWNKLLCERMSKILLKENLNNCSAKTYNAFVLSILGDYLEPIDFDGNNADVNLRLSQKITEALSKVTIFNKYDYIILDESQDTIDRGGAELVSPGSPLYHDYMKDGRFIIFFDEEQAYSNTNREVVERLDEVAYNTARYVLTEAHRYQEQSIKDACKVVLNHIENGELFMSDSVRDELIECGINITDSQIINLAQQKCILKDKEKSIFLQSSKINADGKVEKILTTFAVTKVLNGDTISADEIYGLTSILSFKGLEGVNIKLIIDPNVKLFELYVGISRCCSNLEIVILND